MAEAGDAPLPSAAAPDLSEAQATSDSITPRTGRGYFSTAARNTARGKGTAGWMEGQRDWKERGQDLPL